MSEGVAELDGERLTWMYRQMIAAEVAEHGFSYLRAPVRLVTALDATVPYSKPMEDYILPDEAKIVAAVRSVIP
jgi:acetoin:2,6-dichlorophenolindophenol oxidoreductase subunit beta